MTSGIKITNAAGTISADLTSLNPKWQRTISNPVIVVTVPATDGKVGTKTANLKMMSDQISIRFTAVESFATNFLLPTSTESTVIGKLTYLTKYISAPKKIYMGDYSDAQCVANCQIVRFSPGQPAGYKDEVECEIVVQLTD